MLLVAAAAAILMSPQGNGLVATLRSSSGTVEPGAVALGRGDAARAVKPAGVARTSPVLFLRGSAFLALGNTAAALASLDSAARIPAASADRARQARRS